MFAIHSRGLSFIEILIALSLSVMLLAFIMKLYLSLQNNAHLQAEITHLHEKRDVALEILRKELHLAGFIGCHRITKQFLVLPSQIFTADNAIEVIAKTISVRHMSYPYAHLVKAEGNVLYVTKDINFSSGETVIIADCKRAEIFKLAKVTHLIGQQKLFLSKPLSFEFKQHAYIGKLEANTFFVDETLRQDLNGIKMKSLFVRHNHSKKIELISGVTNMQISYVAKLIKTNMSNMHSGVFIKLKINSGKLKTDAFAYIAIPT